MLERSGAFLSDSPSVTNTEPVCSDVLKSLSNDDILGAVFMEPLAASVNWGEFPSEFFDFVSEKSNFATE